MNENLTVECKKKLNVKEINPTIRSNQEDRLKIELLFL
jgi:hypothetical protein